MVGSKKRKAQKITHGGEEHDEGASASRTQPISKTNDAGDGDTTEEQLTGHGFEAYPIFNAHRLIEPGPVLLVVTGSLDDSTHNVMTIGFHMMVRHDPPLICINLGPWNASFETLKRDPSCVLAVPSVEMANTVVDIGNCSAEDEDSPDKWERFGLTPLPSSSGSSVPIVGGPDVIANIECHVENSYLVKKYAMWVLSVRKVWMNPNKRPGEGGKMFHHRGDGTFVVDGEILDLKERMVKWEEFQD